MLASRLAIVSLLLLSIKGMAQETPPSSVSEALPFNRDIRPILSDNCFHCHGPDKAQRQADLRLDLKEDVFADRDGMKILVPGKPDKSELYRRITSSDESERMPPSDSGRKLTAMQVELLRRWISEGANWQPHWSLIPPSSPNVPEVKNTAWANNPIDRFILSRLASEGLSPSAEADRTTLIRRVTLDLTGLPPTPDEVRAFLSGHKAGGLRAVGGPDALIAALWRADGDGLAGCRPLCRHQRLSKRRSPRHVAVQGLGDRFVQQPSCRSINSRSSNSRAICCPMPRFHNGSPLALTAIIAAIRKAGSFPKNTLANTSWTAWKPRSRSGWA